MKDYSWTQIKTGLFMPSMLLYSWNKIGTDFLDLLFWKDYGGSKLDLKHLTLLYPGLQVQENSSTRF